jgi:hypothetical protein
MERGRGACLKSNRESYSPSVHMYVGRVGYVLADIGKNTTELVLIKWEGLGQVDVLDKHDPLEHP